jgi:putative peptidoglycan lipid II flippase
MNSPRCERINAAKEDSGGESGFLLRIIFSLSAVTVFMKVFGFAEKLVIAHFFGTSERADVYFGTMGIILAIIFFVKELVYPSLLPVFAESLSRKDNSSIFLFKRFFFWAAGILMIVALVQTLFPRVYANFFTPGFSETKKQLTAELLRYLTPAVLFFGLSTIAYTFLNAHKMFFKAALPNAGLKLFIVVGLIALLPFLGLYALAIVLAIGSLGTFLIQLYFIPERRYFLSSQGSVAESDLRKVVHLMMPMVIGVFFSQISELAGNMLASTLHSGHLSFLGYSKKIVDALLLIGPVALVTVIYTQLTHLAKLTDLSEFKKTFIDSLRLLLYFVFPIACLLTTLREPVVKILFERGQFSNVSTLGTSQALLIYGAGFISLSLDTFIVHTFYSLSNTRIPVLAGVICNCLFIFMALIFLKPLGYLGIALAFIIAKTMKSLSLFIILAKRLKPLVCSDFFLFLFKLSSVTLLSWVILRMLYSISHPISFSYVFVFDLLLPTAGFVITFIANSYLLRIKEYMTVLTLIIRRRKPSKQLRGGLK